MAGILEPRSPAAAGVMSGWANARWSLDKLARVEPLVLSQVPDHLRPIPRMMYALMHSTRRELAGVLGGAQTMPGFYAPGRPLRCVVREDRDQPFKVYLIGQVSQAGALDVQVFGPDGAPVRRANVPEGRHLPFEIEVPADGKTGQYVVFVLRNLSGVFLSLPLTVLPEVYVTSHLGTDNKGPGRYFTRSPGEEPCEITIANERGGLFSADRRTVLGTSRKEPFTARIGPEGAWVGSYMGYVRGCYAADKAPLILSVNPGRWFLPGPAACEIQPKQREKSQ